MSVALLASGCVASQRGSGGEGGGTFVYGTSNEAVSLDPVYTQDMASGVPQAQIFEGLVGVEEGGVEPEPVLATKWEVSEDGLTYTFDLREGVTFHDGTKFDADAVCANFDRWYNLPESAQGSNLAYYYGYFFRGFATGANADSAIYESCSANDEGDAVLALKQPFAGLIDALTMPQFSMQSPAAIAEFQDDAATNPQTTAYATEHPTGTGAFAFESWERGEKITLKRFDDYWGEKAKTDRAVLVTMTDAKQRVAALRAGEINGADNVSPSEISALEKDGFEVAPRPPFTLAFVGFNQKRAPLDDKRVREAIAHALDPEAIIKATMPEGTLEANQWLPKGMQGWNEDVTTYPHDLDKAKALIEEAGVAGQTIELNYQGGGGSACMPAPEDTLNIIRQQIEATGLKINPVAIPKAEYGSRIYGTEDHGIEMSCWIGQVNIADSFMGLGFGFPSPEWGFDDPQLFEDLAAATAIPSKEEQDKTYAELSDRLMRDILPGVPFASAGSFIVLAPEVEGFVASPISSETFKTVSME